MLPLDEKSDETHNIYRDVYTRRVVCVCFFFARILAVYVILAEGQKL